jgi:hypothetical protein
MLVKQLDEAKRAVPQQPQQPAEPPSEQEQFLARIREEARQEALSVHMNREFNRSERLARQKYGDEKVEAAAQEFLRIREQAPQIQQVLLEQPDPFEWLVGQHEHVREVGEFTRDSAAYRERIRQELMAEMGQQPQAPQQPAVPPRAPSLAGARSSASRSAPAFSGPPSLDDILGR